MDKKYILENEILHQYMLGDLNESEQKQIEDALNTYPELKLELDQIESNFEIIAFENSISPPEIVKNRLLENIAKDKSIKTLASAHNKKYYMGIAASIIFLFITSYSIYLFKQLNETKNQLQLVEEQNSDLKNNMDSLNDKLQNTNKWYTAINDPETKKYILKGNAIMPNATVVGYVNSKKKMVIVNTSELPKLDALHDYQMWADVEGEMIDMGIIDKNEEMLAMNYIDDAASLNITIEPKGGNDHPTVSKLITNVFLN